MKLFGTDGVRGVANELLTPQLAFKLGAALATVLKQRINEPRVLIGRDTRISGTMLEGALCAGITAIGGHAVVAGVVPTPAVCRLVKVNSFDAGAVISASHNSMEFNGIKFFDTTGIKLSDSLEAEIERLVEEDEFCLATGREIGCVTALENGGDAYLDFLKAAFDIQLTGKKIVVDCAYGATAGLAQRLFSELGANVIPIACEHDGARINECSGATAPENMCAAVRRWSADCGFAFDGDGDRLIACDEQGNVIDGDRVLAILGLMLKKEGKLNKSTVVGTVLSNMGLEKYLGENGISLERTNVGDRAVLERMLENGYSLGGEKSGHTIIGEKLNTGDGMLTALALLFAESVLGAPLSQLGVYREMPQVSVNVRFESVPDIFENERVNRAIEDARKELDGSGRVLVRKSGTEPKVRIMAEGEDISAVSAVAQKIALTVAECFGGKIV